MVYLFQGEHYLVYIGESQKFTTKKDVLQTGEEQEEFTIAHLPEASFLDTLRQLIIEADKRGIKDIKTTETIRAAHAEAKKRGSKSVN